MVDVRKGFFRNWLLPQQKAQMATKENIEKLEARKKVLLEENSKKKEQSEALAKKLEEKVLTFEKEAEENGHLYGSVTPHDILEQLAKEGIDIHKNQVQVTAPFKNVGTYVVRFDLHSEVMAEVGVEIVRKQVQD